MNHRDASVETEIRQKGLTAPRITPEHVDAQIVRQDYFVPGDIVALQAHVYGFDVPQVPAGLACLTICVLTLANGFTVTGESACASPENFDAELGRKISFGKARDKIWALEGYQLRTQLHHDQISRELQAAVSTDQHDTHGLIAGDNPPGTAMGAEMSGGTDANGSPVGDERYGAREG